eukprot:GHVL01038800.1.p1 GENE.GHVL01038800.1~~GHVL01038800.1.p1  ORF type:complete len:1099 (-),score=332.90 GHVL01038800.1:1125-4331(-)
MSETRRKSTYSVLLSALKSEESVIKTNYDNRRYNVSDYVSDSVSDGVENIHEINNKYNKNWLYSSLFYENEYNIKNNIYYDIPFIYDECIYKSELISNIIYNNIYINNNLYIDTIRYTYKKNDRIYNKNQSILIINIISINIIKWRYFNEEEKLSYLLIDIYIKYKKNIENEKYEKLLNLYNKIIDFGKEYRKTKDLRMWKKHLHYQRLIREKRDAELVIRNNLIDEVYSIWTRLEAHRKQSIWMKTDLTHGGGEDKKHEGGGKDETDGIQNIKYLTNVRLVAVPIKIDSDQQRLRCIREAEAITDEIIDNWSDTHPPGGWHKLRETVFNRVFNDEKITDYKFQLLFDKPVLYKKINTYVEARCRVNSKNISNTKKYNINSKYYSTYKNEGMHPLLITFPEEASLHTFCFKMHTIPHSIELEILISDDRIGKDPLISYVSFDCPDPQIVLPKVVSNMCRFSTPRGTDEGYVQISSGWRSSDNLLRKQMVLEEPFIRREVLLQRAIEESIRNDINHPYEYVTAGSPPGYKYSNILSNNPLNEIKPESQETKSNRVKLLEFFHKDGAGSEEDKIFDKTLVYCRQRSLLETNEQTKIVDFFFKLLENRKKIDIIHKNKISYTSIIYEPGNKNVNILPKGPHGGGITPGGGDDNIPSIFVNENQQANNTNGIMMNTGKTVTVYIQIVNLRNMPKRNWMKYNETDDRDYLNISQVESPGVLSPRRGPRGGSRSGEKTYTYPRIVVEVQMNNISLSTVVAPPTCDPDFNNLLRFPVNIPSWIINETSVTQFNTDIIFSVFDDITQTWINDCETVVRNTKRFLGSFRLTWPVIFLNMPRLEGQFRLNIPHLLGYSLVDSETFVPSILLIVTLDPLVESAIKEPPMGPSAWESDDILAHILKWEKNCIKKAPKNTPPKALIRDIDGSSILLCRFLRGLDPPVGDLDDPFIREKCAHFVSLIPFYDDVKMNHGVEDLCLTDIEFLKLKCGGWIEHSTLLCNFFIKIDFHQKTKCANYIAICKSNYEGDIACVIRQRIEAPWEFEIWKPTCVECWFFNLKKIVKNRYIDILLIIFLKI